ncbi:MAG: site-specific integrase [Symploca sp. SIO3E6]|nr:site-specific integrase [Caldora sp. SIO3E6]
MKSHGCGQAEVFSRRDRSLLQQYYSKNSKHRTMLDIAFYTGERWGAIRQLLVEDCYQKSGQPKAAISFRRRTRKGKDSSRVIPVSPLLEQSLRLYQPEGVLMFPGKPENKPISRVAVHEFFQKAIKTLGFDQKGYSLHGTRATAVTMMHDSGVSLEVIRQITGHH